MDMISVFEQMLQSNSDQPIELVEQNWNEKAKSFYYNQLNGSTYYPDAVTQLLVEKGILTPSSSILDIGSGSGRYAIPFAKKCQTVYALDLSSEMLQFMQQEIEKNNLDNVHTIKSAWPTTEKIEKIDVAFAAMCPATRSIDALNEMSNIAHKHGVICQFIESTDNIVEALKRQQLIGENGNDPHNNPDILPSYFNILWELGYHPEISYLHDTFEMQVILEEAVDLYQKRYEYIDSEQLKNLLRTMQQEDETIQITKNTTLAVLSWNTGYRRKS